MYEILDLGIVGLGPLYPAIWEVVYCFVAVQHWPVQPVGIIVQDFPVNHLDENGCTVHDVVAWCETFVPTLNTLSHATTISIFGIGPLKRLQGLNFLPTLRSCFAPRLIAVRFTPVHLAL